MNNLILIKNVLNNLKENQDLKTKLWHSNNEIITEIDLENFILTQHKFNFDLWHQEDIARKKDVNDSEIAKVKRNIDLLNQKRNDFIEKIDENILVEISKFLNEKSIQHSETIGSIIDKLSILSLKIYHMKEQTLRKDVDFEHLKICNDKLKTLCLQRDDLHNCLIQLFDNIIEGKKYFKIYRQYKMYNDPKLNPELYIKNK